MTMLDDIWRLLRLDFSRLEFRSPLPVDDCEARLRDLTAWHVSPRGRDEASPVVGDVSREDFFLYARPVSRNAFQTCLAGRMIPTANGTVLECRFTIFLLAKIMLFLWFVVGAWLEIRMFDAAAGSLLHGSGQLESGYNAWWGIAIPPLAFLLGIGGVRLGRIGANEEQRSLIRFLAWSIDARRILDGASEP